MFFYRVHPAYVSKLKMDLYRLKEAPRAWFTKLSQFLLEWRFKNSQANTSLMVFENKDSFIIIPTSVDDILITWNDTSVIKEVIVKLNSKFPLKEFGDLSYFLGFEGSKNIR